MRIPPIFSEAEGKIYKEKEEKKSTNVINSHFSLKIPLFFNPRRDTEFSNL
jgi:hypothetical protein